KQKAILNAAATLLRPGGRLVYATCSVLTQENRAVVEEFLAGHPEYTRIDCREALEDSHIGIECGEYLELRPQLHDTDAFFAAVLQKNA
ncbi:MAG: SAM-dependent methyltransferase, partial [Betaproteobacteria bacterium]